MLITSISLRNFMGVREAKYDLGRITEIAGKNGKGKTTLVAAIQNAIGGGDLAKLANVDGKEEPELGLVINNGEYLVERKGKETVVRQRVGTSAAYEKVRKPQTFIDSLYDAMLSDPMRLYKASPKDQLDILLEILAQDLTGDQIKEAIGEDLWPSIAAPVAAGGHPLQVLANVRQALYDERTGVNRTKLDKERTAQTVRTGIPADMPDASGKGIAALEQERDALAGRVREAKANAEARAREIVADAEGKHQAAEASGQGEFKAAAAKRRSAAEKEVAEATAAAEEQIRAIRAALQEKAVAIRAAADTDVETLRTASEMALDEADAILAKARQQAEAERQALLAQVEGAEAQLADVAARLERARTEAEQYTRLVALKDEADRHDAEAKSLAGRSERLSAGLDAVERLKGSLLEALPIPGLEVDGKTIKLNRVPLDQVNKEARLMFAANVAALRAQRHPLKLVFVDDAEALDTEHRELLLKTLEERGVQVIVARVDDGALRVDAREHAITA